MGDDGLRCGEDIEAIIEGLREHRRFDYFGCFEAMVGFSVKEANLLLEVIEGFRSADGVEGRLEEAHGIEGCCDSLVQAAMEAADEDFLPPIEREDVVELVVALDQITDELEKCIKHLFMYNVKHIEPDSVKMCRLIREECTILCDSMALFRDFRKPKKLRKYAVQIDELENEIDRLYLYAIHGLFADEVNTLRVIKWQAIYSTIERCSDAIEHAIDLMVRIVVKNA